VSLMTLARRVFAALWCAVAAVAIWAMWASRFAATAAGEEIALVGALIFGAVSAWAAFANTSFQPGSPRYQENVARYPGMSKPASRAVLGGVFGALMAFLSVRGGVLEFWTMAFGSPGQVVMHLGHYNGGGRSECSGYDLQEASFFARRIVCASAPYGEEALPGTPVDLSGMVSPFGVEVTSFSIRPDPSPE
jgi:hypothetical protein